MTFAILFLVVGALLNQASCHHCGKQENVGIIGGHQIPIERAPYMASLRIVGLVKNIHFCGGSIIHEKFILTAAHCLVRLQGFLSNIRVLVGTEDTKGNGGDLIEIEKFVIHKDFSNETLDNDVAVIKLKEPLKFGPKVAKIDLPDAFVVHHTPEGTKLNVTGWGRTENLTQPSKLLQAEIPLVDHNKCKDIYFSIGQMNITSQMLCAGSLGVQSYFGDSGGPFTLNDMQFGIVSFTTCVPGQSPGVFANVSSLSCWILKTMISMLN